MKTILKKIIKLLLPSFFINFINMSIKRVYVFLNWNPWTNYYYSQEGEDILLQRIFNSQKKGFYIDIGAHHPKRFSNTYLFYQRGWQGINIDCMPESMKLFEKLRPRDINLELGIAENESINDYYIFNEPALNSFSKEHSEKMNQANNKYYIKKIIKVKTMPLSKILDIHLKNKEIDFLDIDVEGMDLGVLSSNDWSKYRPKFVLVEIINNNLNNMDKDPVIQFMKKHNYIIYAKLDNTVFFKDLSVDIKY